jgi:hypothetical protein
MEVRKKGRAGAGAVTGGAHRAKQIVIHEQLEPCARRPHLNSQSLPALEQLHFYIARPHVGAHWKTDHYLPGCAGSMRRNASRLAGYEECLTIGCNIGCMPSNASPLHKCVCVLCFTISHPSKTATCAPAHPTPACTRWLMHLEQAQDYRELIRHFQVIDR